VRRPKPADFRTAAPQPATAKALAASATSRAVAFRRPCRGTRILAGDDQERPQVPLTCFPASSRTGVRLVRASAVWLASPTITVVSPPGAR